MFRNKEVILCIIIPILAIIGAIGYGIYKDSTSKQYFSNSGYILVSPDSTYSDEINNQIYFEEGTSYKYVYPNQIEFTNADNEKMIVPSESFVHYNDGSIGSLSPGVMVDLQSIEEPIVSHYGLSPESTIERSGSDYLLDNRGSAMSFQDFVWKITDNKFLLVGNNILIQFTQDNERVFNDYIEVSYYDTGIIRIVSQEGTWQTVSDNCIATLDNGTKLNLSKRTVIEDGNNVKFSLEQMVIGADDNIDIVPQEVKEQVIKAPKFEVEVINGADGVIGEAGKAGEAGEDGEAGKQGEVGQDGTAGADGEIGVAGIAGEPGAPGTTGTTGISGANGINGVNGANGASGANGAKGEQGVSGDELANKDNPGNTENLDNVRLPIFEVKSLTVNTSGFSAAFTVMDDESRLDPTKPFALQIIDNITGKQVYQSSLDSSQRDFTHEYYGLLPNTEYRLIIAADYVVDNVAYNRFFVNKLFKTEALGITIEKAFATETTLGIKVKMSDYSQIEAANLQVLADGEIADRTKKIDMIQAAEAGGCTVVFDTLVPNTKYNIKVVGMQMRYDMNLVAPPEVRTETFWTLKRVPLLGAVQVVVNKRNANFEMSLAQVTDLDGAILRYRYEIYEIAYNGDKTLVKQLYNTANDVIPCYIDETVIKRGYNYRMRIVAECYDNEKNVEFASAFSDVVSITGTNYPIVLFEKDDNATHHDKITGKIIINTNGTIVTVNALNPLIVEWKNSKGDTDTYQITELSQPWISNNDKLYTIPFSQGDLMAKDNYIVSVYGTIDLNDGAGAKKSSLIGSSVVPTDTPAKMTATFTQSPNLTSPISFMLNLSDASADVSSAYEASTMEYLEINLYNGDETSVTNSAPIATFIRSGTGGENYASTLGSSVYGNGNTLTLDEKSFNINPAAITSSKYTVEISSIRDYTKYGNEFTVINNVKTFTKEATLPNLKDIDTSNGLTVTPITLLNIGQHVTDPATLLLYQKFNSDVIFGYEVSASYFDNSAQMVEEFSYYAFEEKNYGTPASAQSLYQGVETVARIDKPVDGFGTVPKAVFLFGFNGIGINGMSRGSKYVFTYRAKLKKSDPDGTPLYFPESVDPAVVIRSRTALAPYQTPAYYFYPWSSGTDFVSYKYYIKAPDAEAIASGFSTTMGSIASGAVKLNQEDAPANPVVLNVEGLTRGNTFTVSIQSRQYKTIYAEVFTNTLVRQYFDATFVWSTTLSPTNGWVTNTKLSYKMEDLQAENRYRISITDASTERQISRIVAIKVTVDKVAIDADPPETITIPLDNVTGPVGVGFLSYSDIEDYLGSTLNFTVTAIYDSGISGFDGATDGSARAIQILSTAADANYITLNQTNTALVEDISGYAKGSYFKMTGNENKTATIAMNYSSNLVSTHVGVLDILKDQTGARLRNISGQPNITLKKLEELVLPVTGDESNPIITQLHFGSMTPTVTLNNGAAYTIDTNVTSATVNWIMHGHAAKLAGKEMESSDGVTGKVRFELYKYDANNMPVLMLGNDNNPIEIITPINATINSYSTFIGGLERNTKYGIKIYYIDSSGNKAYPINSYRPKETPSSNIYIFTTNESITVKPAAVAPVTYVAIAYMDKYLQIKYTLNQTLGFNINYSLVKKTGETYTPVLTSSELAARGIIRTPAINRESMSDERFMLLPGQVYWTEDGKRVYFPFNSNDYYLCIQPVSQTNSSTTVGEAAYILLNVPQLNKPFYNIKTIPDNGKVSFQISVVDIAKVIVGGKYKVKAFNPSGTDITPVAYKNVDYPITQPASIDISVPPGDPYVELRLYAEYDLLNTTYKADKTTALKDISTVSYEELEEMDGDEPKYFKKSIKGSPLGSYGYNLGTVQIAQSSSDLARLYFTNAVNLSKLRHIRYVVINEAGYSYNYSELFTPIASGTDSHYYELSHRFQSTGIYQIQVRFYDDTMQEMEDKTMIYYKTY